jgi:hypothetical protein
MSGGSGLHRHAFRILWPCNGPSASGCFATAEASDVPMPPDLTPWEQELFDKAPLPKDGWTLVPCPQHRNTFADHPEEPD